MKTTWLPKCDRMTIAHRHVVIWLLVLGCLWSGIDQPFALAGEFNEVLSIGDAAPRWTDLPGTDGKTYSLADLSSEVVVVVFTCASCPTAVDYETRLSEFVKQYANSPQAKVAVAVICSNQIEADRLPALTARVRDRQLPFTYLHDETQAVAKQYGALFTPEFFVLNRERRVVYMGAFDDKTDPAQVTQRHVEQAVQATLAGEKPKVTETIVRGCRIRFARKRD